MADQEKKLVGMAGLFDTPDALIDAASEVHRAGWDKWDCHTPYPVHGLDQAMGVRRSIIPTICLTAGFVGAAVAMLMQWWMSAVDYPVRIGGKPLFSWPAFVPITFEFFVLFAGLTVMGCVIFFCRLGRWHSPLHDSGIMQEVTSSRYAVVLGTDGARFSRETAADLLEKSGCRDIRPVFELEEVKDGSLL